MPSAEEKRLTMNWLMDFYAGLLTERQRQVMELHHGEDMSLAEIAQLLSISRQGAYDSLHRAEEQLLLFEERLGLAARYRAVDGFLEELEVAFAGARAGDAQARAHFLNEWSARTQRFGAAWRENDEEERGGEADGGL